MKYLVISDIHGSAYYLEKALQKFDELRLDQIIILGDVLYHGARNDLPKGHDTKKCFTMLNRYADKIIAVRGNCDSEVDQMVLEFENSSDFLVLPMKKFLVYLNHGHIEIGQMVKSGNVILEGHIHVKQAFERNGITYLNPGSLSIPKDSDFGSYAILDDDSFKVYSIEDDSLALEYFFN